MNGKWLLAAVSAMALGASARTFEVAAWRGETVAARVPDFAELGQAPAGIGVRTGVLKSVKYAPEPESLQRLECFDRVKWGSDDEGPRVVEVRVPESVMPGVYACGAMSIRVVDRVLPPAKDWKSFLDLWQHPWAVARVAKAKPFSRKHYAAMKPVWETLAAAGQKALTVTIVPQAWDHQCCDAYGTMIGRVKKADGSWKFDYSVFDEYVGFGRKCGLGPDIACYTMCPWGYICRYQTENGETVSVECKPGTPAFDDYWGAFLDDFAGHLRAKGWLQDTYIAMDERSIEDVRTIGAFIRKHVPEMKIAMAGNKLPSEYGVTIDNFCMVLGGGINGAYLKEAAERRAKGMKTTCYVCCVPRYPNTFMSSGPGEAFWLGAYPAMCGLDGFLRWAWNSWPFDPVKDASYGPWRAGDTFLVYPDGSPSWRFLELRNGIVASEKIRILKEKGLFADDIARLSKRFIAEEAAAGKSDYRGIRDNVLKLVNRTGN
ncbi:MAG: DUF4091 domain-containing protein [Kiritimatiellae bacterium]|nr:DUF4091 domain-containing protein [Kiritimatiellia bacterium]